MAEDENAGKRLKTPENAAKSLKTRKSLKTPEAEDLHKYFEVFEETVAISLVFPSIKRQKT